MRKIATALEKMSTQELQTLLAEECNGDRSLSIEQILDICQILSARKASGENKVYAAWERFLANYAPDNNN